MIRFSAILVLLFTLFDHVSAQEINRCLTLSDSSDRLACFDDAHNTPHAIRFPQALPDNTQTQKPVSAPKPKLTPEERFGQSTANIKKQTARDDNIDNISSNIEAAGFSRAGSTRITLANGQIWQQLNSDDTTIIPSRLRRQTSVEIKRGTLGGYIMKIKPWGRSMKVRRIK